MLDSKFWASGGCGFDCLVLLLFYLGGLFGFFVLKLYGVGLFSPKQMTQFGLSFLGVFLGNVLTFSGNLLQPLV